MLTQTHHHKWPAKNPYTHANGSQFGSSHHKFVTRPERGEHAKIRAESDRTGRQVTGASDACLVHFANPSREASIGGRLCHQLLCCATKRVRGSARGPMPHGGKEEEEAGGQGGRRQRKRRKAGRARTRSEITDCRADTPQGSQPHASTSQGRDRRERLRRSAPPRGESGEELPVQTSAVSLGNIL